VHMTTCAQDVRRRRAGRRAAVERTEVRPTNQGPAMEALLLATLQQRWCCNAATAMALQHATLLLLQRYSAPVAAAKARSDGAIAALAAALLELAAALCSAAGARSDGAAGAHSGAVQRCWSSQQWRCWSS
jgi:hypothetical protein